MEIQEWKDYIIEKAKRSITYRQNMSKSDIESLTFVLSDYLEKGINILRSWRKLKDDSEFLNRLHDSGLIDYLENSYQANGRSVFSSYNSGGVSSNMDKTPKSILQSTCKQVM